MSGSVFGKCFVISTWGESHGAGIGVVVDGCPAGLPLNEEVIQEYLDRRKPGQTQYSTPRKENDRLSILSGIFEGRTTGTPISLVIYNENHRPYDYSEIAKFYRPGHADYTYDQKYGFRDYRGGGRSSGRETSGRVAAGAIAAAILKELGISIITYTKSIGAISIDYSKCKKEDIKKSPLNMPDMEASVKAEAYLKELIEDHNSTGGVIECIVSGMPDGIGQPVFDKLDAALVKAVMSIGAIKGVEIGDGYAAAGGILGGISDGTDIILRAAVKPTASIARAQRTVNKNKENITVEVQGRHDPIIVPRAVVVVESMVAITLVDYLFQGMTSRMDRIKEFWR